MHDDSGAEPSAETERLRTELKMLGNQHKRWREKVPILHERIRQAKAAGIPTTEIAELSGYERDNVRLLCKDEKEREQLRARRRKPVPAANAELVEQMERTATNPAVRVKRGRPTRKEQA